jgi:hypothetical protein
MSTQNKIDEIAEPLSKGEKAFKALHAVNPNKKLVPGITDQDHVFSGGERKLDKPTASLEIYKSEDESEEEYDKNLKAKSKEESFFASVLGKVLGEAGKQNWDKAHRDDRNEREGAKVGRKSMKPYRQPGEESKSEKRAGLSSMPGYKEALAKRGLKEAEDITDEELNEVLSKNDSASKWIHDFVHSDNPKFKGKSTKERQKMALGAYYAAQKEEVEMDEALGTMANIKAATEFGKNSAQRIASMVRSEKQRKAAEKKEVKKEVKEDVDYDYEGEMAKTELRAMCDKADKLANMLSDDQQLEAWLQSKISKAKDYIDAVYDYMVYRDKPTVAAAPVMPSQSDAMASTYGTFLNRMGEEVEQVEEKMTKSEFASQAHPHDKATFADKLALIKKKNPKADIEVKTEELELKSPALLKALNKVI